MSPISYRWRIVVAAALIPPMLATAGCWPSSSSSSKQGAPTPAATQATPAATTAASPTPATGDYCVELIRVNTENGTMVGKNQISIDKWTPAQVKAIVDFTVAHNAEILAISPPEIKAAMVVDLQWWQAVQDANYNVTGAKVPPGFSDAVAQISNYQHTTCGINFG